MTNCIRPLDMPFAPAPKPYMGYDLHFTRQDVYDTLMNLLNNRLTACDALDVIDNVLKLYPDGLRKELFKEYAWGYCEWLAAGLPLQTVEQLRSTANSVPRIAQAFKLAIEASRPPLQPLAAHAR